MSFPQISSNLCLKSLSVSCLTPQNGHQLAQLEQLVGHFCFRNFLLTDERTGEIQLAGHHHLIRVIRVIDCWPGR